MSNASAIEPFRIWRRSISFSKWGYQLPQWWIFGASSSKARRMSKSGVRSSRSRAIASTAALAVSSSSAATMAIGWPLYRTSSFARSGSSAGMPRAERWPYSRSGTSFHVTTACTPGIASAFEVSSPLISALWTGERSAFAHSIPDTRTSSTKIVRPVTCSIPS